MASVRLDRVTKTYAGDAAGKVAVHDLTLDVKDGEFVSVLGPSGCGKTTTLRMIAGFEAPTRGEIYFDSEPVSHLPPERRRAGMVFQNYALFPHLDVFDNVAFGLKVRKLRPAEIRDKVAAAIATVGLAGYGAREVQGISGGEQQRVALARALVTEPRILLLDEPLSNLDARLRDEMRRSLRELQRRLRVTTVFVTHDQREALSLSDRVAVMRSGKLLEFDTPEALYARPRTAFVARFVADAEIVGARAEGGDATGFVARLEGGGALLVRDGAPPPRDGEAVTLAVPPDALRPAALAKSETGAERPGVLAGFTVGRRDFFGAAVEYRLSRGASEWRSRAPFHGETLLAEGARVTVAADPFRIFRVVPEEKA